MRVERIPPQTQASVINILGLTEYEAAVLLKVCHNISGEPNGSRSVTEKIGHHLRRIGIIPVDGIAHGSLTLK